MERRTSSSVSSGLIGEYIEAWRADVQTADRPFVERVGERCQTDSSSRGTMFEKHGGNAPTGLPTPSDSIVRTLGQAGR